MRRRVLKKHVELVFSWLFIAFMLAVLNGSAFYSSTKLGGKISSFRMTHFLNDFAGILLFVEVIIAAVLFDKLVLDGLFRGHLIPDLKSRADRSEVSPGDLVNVEYEIVGSEDWVVKVRAHLKCIEVSWEMESRVLFNDLVYSSSKTGVFSKGHFSFEIPDGFPATNIENQRKMVLWVLEIRGATRSLIRDAKVFHEFTVVEKC